MRGFERTWDTAFTWFVWESPRRQCGQGELVFLALVGPAVRRLGDSAPRWPAGSPAQWRRPRIWICVGPRDPATKPSRGCLRVVELSAILQLPPHKKFQGKELLRKKRFVSWAVAPASISTQKKTKRKTRPAIRRSARSGRKSTARCGSAPFNKKNARLPSRKNQTIGSITPRRAHGVWSMDPWP